MRSSHVLKSAVCLSLCGACTGPAVTDVHISDNPDLVLEKIFSVTLSDPAALAIRCTRDDLSTEVHLVESSEAALEHELRLHGLVAETSYTCDVAPVDAKRATPSQGSFTTAALPDSIPSAAGVANGDPGAAYTFMPHQRLATGETSIRLVLMDNAGEVRWYYPLPIEGYADMGAEYWGEGLFLWGGVSASAAGAGAPRLVDLSHNEVYRSAYEGAEDAYYHHMTEKQSDGSVVTLVEADASSEGRTYYGFEIHQVDVESDALTWSWSLQEGLDSGGPGVGDANWAGMMVEDDGTKTMVVSVCIGEGVIGVDMESGEVAWSLADDWGTLDLVEGDFPRVQHGLDIDGQRILLYDNGAVPTTRAVEYLIDPAEGTATQTWSWTEEGFNESWGWGDVDYLGEDHVVITKGHIPDFGSGEGPSEVIEVDRSDNSVAWRLSFSDELDAIYSADRIGGCDLFAEASRCAAVSDRIGELEEWFQTGE